MCTKYLTELFYHTITTCWKQYFDMTKILSIFPYFVLFFVSVRTLSQYLTTVSTDVKLTMGRTRKTKYIGEWRLTYGVSLVRSFIYCKYFLLLYVHKAWPLIINKMLNWYISTKHSVLLRYISFAFCWWSMGDLLWTYVLCQCSMLYSTGILRVHLYCTYPFQIPQE